MLPSCGGRQNRQAPISRGGGRRWPSRWHRSFPTLPAGIAGLIAAFLAAAVACSSVRADDDNIRLKRNSEQTTFSDAEIADGFFKIAFGAELRIAGDDSRVRKFDGPVRVYFDNQSQANRRADIAAVISDIRTFVDHLDIALTTDRKAANVVVSLLENHDALLRTMRARYGHKRADEIERRLTPRCLSGFAEDTAHRITRAEVLLTADGDDFSFLDCAYEELLQALGPINDDRSVPWTMFNDDIHMGFFDVYDQYILNILYDPRVRPGMTRQQIKTQLTDILPTVRHWISEVNSARRLGASNETGTTSEESSVDHHAKN
jgi:hypothetical protein